MLGHVLPDLARGDRPREGDHDRDVDLLVVPGEPVALVAALPRHPIPARVGPVEDLAVVRGEDHHGLLPEAQPVQRGHELAHVAVRPGHLGQVGQGRGQRVDPLQGVGHRGEDLLRRLVGLVRRQEVELQEEGLIAMGLHERHGEVCQDRRVLGVPAAVLQDVEAWIHSPLVRGEVEVIMDRAQGEVAGAPEEPGEEGRLLRVEQRPAIHLVPIGHQEAQGPRMRAEEHGVHGEEGGVAVGEAHGEGRACGLQRVDVGRDRGPLPAAVHPHHVRSQRVHHDVDHVARRRLGGGALQPRVAPREEVPPGLPGHQELHGRVPGADGDRHRVGPGTGAIHVAAREGPPPELRVPPAQDHLQGALPLGLVERGRVEDQAAPGAPGEGEARGRAAGEDQRVAHVLEGPGLFPEHHPAAPGMAGPRGVPVPHLLDPLLRLRALVGVGEPGGELRVPEVVQEPALHPVAGRVLGVRSGRGAEQGQEDGDDAHGLGIRSIRP